MSITAKECIKKIDEALKEFGRYSYYDKGAEEVMDIPAIVLEQEIYGAKKCKKNTR